MTVDYEKELRANKIEMIQFLAEQMVTYKFNEFKDYPIAEDADIPTLDAEIKVLRIQVKKAKLGQAKVVKFDKLEADRANLTPEELKQLQEDQERINSRQNWGLGVLEQRASLKGNIDKPNTIILRYRGNGIDNEFRSKYPDGVLM
ncbi:hypothetical protein LCGC14_0708710 [marine sediment metagenome]|uniref:Uncharacterized protein n=1 Tax=marine sediment metagenome TaxID=412755 RepID=A0A0F9R163_9ZZZZ